MKGLRLRRVLEINWFKTLKGEESEAQMRQPHRRAKSKLIPDPKLESINSNQVLCAMQKTLGNNSKKINLKPALWRVKDMQVYSNMKDWIQGTETGPLWLHLFPAQGTNVPPYQSIF